MAVRCWRFALGGSVSLNSISNLVDAHITINSNVIAPGAITVTATDRPTIQALAGGVAGAGAAAIGAALATNEIGDTDTAYIDRSTITSQASITVSATSTSSMETITVGGAGAGAFALGGSVSLNSIANTIEAYITTFSHVTAPGAITVSATDTSTIKAIAGAAAGAGAAAIGAALGTNDDISTISAYLATSTVASSQGSVDVTASYTPTVSSLCLALWRWPISPGRVPWRTSP